MISKRKAIFLDRDGVLNKERDFVFTPEELELYDFTAPAIKKINQSEYLAIVVTNQSGIARNYYTLDTLEKIHAKLKQDLAKYDAALDAIYFCPHHPDTELSKGNPNLMECECRKPKSGMLLQAADDFKLHLPDCYIIGDADRDIICGKNVGVKTIAVKTGKGAYGITTEPDYWFENVLDAVSFILKVAFVS